MTTYVLQFLNSASKILIECYTFLFSVRCPFLPVSHFHDNLEVSSLSNAVGSVVEFICTGGEVLSGPSILQCSASGIWNGSIPTCIDNSM